MVQREKTIIVVCPWRAPFFKNYYLFSFLSLSLSFLTPNLCLENDDPLILIISVVRIKKKNYNFFYKRYGNGNRMEEIRKKQRKVDELIIYIFQEIDRCLAFGVLKNDRTQSAKAKRDFITTMMATSMIILKMMGE